MPRSFVCLVTKRTLLIQYKYSLFKKNDLTLGYKQRLINNNKALRLILWGERPDIQVIDTVGGGGGSLMSISELHLPVERNS